MIVDFSNFDENAKAFLSRVAAELNTPGDLEHSFRVTRAVFYVLRDTINTADSDDLIAQLPADIGSIYMDNWDTAKDRVHYDKSEDIYNAIRDNSINVGDDFFDEPTTRQSLQAVFKVLREPSTQSVLDRIKAQLPESLRTNV